MEIQKHAENTNLDCGLSLSPIWALYLSLWLVSPHIYHVRFLIFIITSFPAYPFIRIIIIFPCTCAICHCSWWRSTDRIHYSLLCYEKLNNLFQWLLLFVVIWVRCDLWLHVWEAGCWVFVKVQWDEEWWEIWIVGSAWVLHKIIINFCVSDCVCSHRGCV